MCISIPANYLMFITNALLARFKLIYFIVLIFLLDLSLGKPIFELELNSSIH